MYVGFHNTVDVNIPKLKLTVSKRDINWDFLIIGSPNHGFQAGNSLQGLLIWPTTIFCLWQKSGKYAHTLPRSVAYMGIIK